MVRFPVSPVTTFLYFTLKPEGYIWLVDRKQSRKKYQGMAGWGVWAGGIKTHSQGYLWCLRSWSALWIRMLQGETADAESRPTSHHWCEAGWTLQERSELCLLVIQKMASKEWCNPDCIFLFMSSLMTLDSCVNIILPLDTEGTHISLGLQDDTPFGSHLSIWEHCCSPRKPWHHRVWGRRCFWSGWKVIPSYTRLSRIIVWEENGVLPILTHVQTQGAASDVQMIERKKKKKRTFDDCSSFSLLTYYFILFRKQKGFL